MMSLTDEDLKKFSRSFLKNHATLLSMIATERATKKNKKIQAAVNSMCEDFFTIVCSYTTKLAYFDLANDCKEALAATYKNINQVGTTVSIDKTERSADFVRVTTLYPAGNKKQRSCVIEVSADTRRLLLSRGRVNLRWHSCRVEDHLSIMQCFKCSGFSRIAARCNKEPCCAYCAGEHLSEVCNTKSQLKCINCVSAGLSDYSHSAKDKDRCVVPRQRIEQKTNTINYG
ncbi:hypothetical protein TKK_0012068 [Trichogramma kaykai]